MDQDDTSHAMTLPSKQPNLVCNNEPEAKIHMEIKEFELMDTTTRCLLPDPTVIKLPLVSVGSDRSAMSVSSGEDFKEGDDVMKFVIQNPNNEISSKTVDQEESDCSQSVVILEVNSLENAVTGVDSKNSNGIPQDNDKSCSLESNSKLDNEVAVNNEVVGINGNEERKCTMNLEAINKNKISTLCYIPIWGIVSLQGRRSEMEDAVVAFPNFMDIPTSMEVLDGSNQSFCHSTTHFFGVYDGHGGSQVANYCRDYMHLILAEEMKIVVEHYHNRSEGYEWQEQWEQAFLRCFRKIDADVDGVCLGNEGSTTEADKSHPKAIAPEAVGSTAIVSIICSTHVVVANCGDSRAVLCRGKQAVSLSVDHKPNRDDECKRIEAAGGKVIYWDDHRVSGVLGMSRSIGDRYLEKFVIPDPEVKFIPRTKEDECVILATDGLWDVVKNEEACDVARRCILYWHKKNGAVLSGRGDGIDPAAQSAADYLSKLALQRGSKDNISVVVIDLKAHRKFKKKT